MKLKLFEKIWNEKETFWQKNMNETFREKYEWKWDFLKKYEIKRDFSRKNKNEKETFWEKYEWNLDF